MDILKKIKYFGFGVKCPLCNSMLTDFSPLDKKFRISLNINGEIYNVNDYETLNVDHFMCPVCGADDRTRLYVMFLKEKLKEYNIKDKIQLLHFAPERPLQKILKDNLLINYRSADLYMNGVDDKIDITNMNAYSDNTFDIIICSHVLEHITEVNKAISELYRVMKSGAFAILMAPIIPELAEDYENESIISPEDRLKYFGQDDHVRVFSKKGFRSKLKNNNFILKELGIEYFGEEAFRKNRITSKSVLYIVEKA